MFHLLKNNELVFYKNTKFLFIELFKSLLTDARLFLLKLKDIKFVAFSTISFFSI